MSMNIFFAEGDGINDDQYALTIALGDTNGGTIAVNGTMTAVGQSQVNISATPAIPAAPASGLIYFNLQVDPVNGTVTMYQSVSAQPSTTLSANGLTSKRIIYNTQMSSTQTDPALDSGVTPDNPVGLP